LAKKKNFGLRDNNYNKASELKFGELAVHVQYIKRLAEKFVHKALLVFEV
jgi:hypothetical protein